jgi:aspartokinase
MLTIKHYRRPLAGIAISGERARLTPEVLLKFISPLAKKNIQIYAIGTGNSRVVFFVDEAEADKAMLVLSDAVGNSPFESISIRRNLGMITVDGEELNNTPGILHKLTTPLAKAKIKIVSMTSPFDTITFFFDSGDAEKAYNLWNRYVPEKIGIFKGAKQHVGGIFSKILPKA